MKRLAWIAMAALPGPVCAAAANTNASTSAEFFELRVRPVLAKNCYACHNGSHMGGLDLNSREALLKGGNNGPAIVAGNPQASLLIQAVRKEHERIKMPPSGPGLKPEEIADLSTWIKDGAFWPSTPTSAPAVLRKQITPEQRAFWSFQPVKPPADPNATIDSIAGKSSLAAADKRTLLRRVTFDLTGLPPTPEEADAFLADKSPNAYAKVVDRLLASPHYGERWGRVWLDVARYSDDKLNSEYDDPRPNAYRYRDWVIEAFNDDMPYDTFAKAQIAGDLMGKPELIAGLGMYAMSPEFQDDRVDVTTRGFLGLTVACAQCHDHKFDPIPTRDFYSLQGIFDNTEVVEHPLAGKATVDEYKKRRAELDAREKEQSEFLKAQGDQLADILAHRAAEYLNAARGKGDAKGLDAPTLERWKKYLARKRREHPFLDNNPSPEDFQKLLLDVEREKKEIDQKNTITLGNAPNRNDLSSANLASLERNRYFLWKDFFGDKGVLFYGQKEIVKYLAGPWKDHAASLAAQVETAKKAMPPQYPFVYALKDKNPHPPKMHVHVRGNPQNLGEEAPPEFLAILSDGPQKPFTRSPRLELAESIANTKDPLFARVIVNRIWLAHFGEGIVKSPSNFGQMGERPDNAALLDYLAWRLIDDGWRIKPLQREIVMSAEYRAVRKQPQRLEAEELRDEILMDSGELDLSVGGQAAKLDAKNKRRTIYGYVSRRKLDPILELFDFPNPNQTSEQRISTDVPLQRLFLLNSPLVLDAAAQLAKRVEAAGNDNARIASAYRILFTRPATPRERKIGLEYLKTNPLPQYLQVLMASDEFLHID